MSCILTTSTLTLRLTVFNKVVFVQNGYHWSVQDFTLSYILQSWKTHGRKLAWCCFNRLWCTVFEKSFLDRLQYVCNLYMGSQHLWYWLKFEITTMFRSLTFWRENNVHSYHSGSFHGPFEHFFNIRLFTSHSRRQYIILDIFNQTLQQKKLYCNTGNGTSG